MTNQFLIHAYRQDLDKMKNLILLDEAAKAEIYYKLDHKQIDICAGFPIEMGYEFFDEEPRKVISLNKVSNSLILVTHEKIAE